MERPLSMVAAHATAPVHKRTASSISSLSKLKNPSFITLYITNLKLLDLDLLQDWPDLSALSFSTSESRTRIRSTEWSLYQLFLLFDPRLTTEKLQPFFPPLEHMQSVNLRAALHRCLAELKKNGVLGREIVLRKTMLDDCSGEKFWELCLSFSALVLRKATLDTRPRLVQSAAYKSATSQSLSKREKESLLPLAIAHKAALTRVLSTKSRKRESFNRLSRLLTAKESDLLDRVSAIEHEKPLVTSEEHAEDLDTIEQALARSSISSSTFIDAIVNGDPIRSDDMLLLQSKHEFLGSLDSYGTNADTRHDSGVIADLQQRANFQRARVGQWQALYDQLRAAHPCNKAEHIANSTSSVSYDLHYELSTEDLQPATQLTTTQVDPARACALQYDEILTSMREELRRTQSSWQDSSWQAKKPDLPRKPSIALDVVAGASSASLVRSPSRRSISPMLPFRPGLQRRASSRSYQQPRVVSQREPIPLKAESFSPTKQTRLDEFSPAQLQSSLATGSIQNAHNEMSAKRQSQESTETSITEGGVGLGLLMAESTTASQTDSLVERTRKSMVAVPSVTAPSSGLSPVTIPPTMLDHEPVQDTLSSRARQSMSSLSVNVQARTSASMMDNSSAGNVLNVQKKRVGQSALPKVPETNSLLPASEAASHRDITPREKLFGADAEVSSVFRSRPKIATSPVLSPQRLDQSVG